MRTQPEYIIGQLEIHPSRLNKEAILESAMEEGLDDFFEGVTMCLDNLYTFGVKQVPEKSTDEGQGLAWVAFKQLAQALNRRELTGHAARDAILLAMGVATQSQWNLFYRRILIKDLRCGVSEKTVNKAAGKYAKYAVPVFDCQLAHDAANHDSKLAGVKLVEKKLDGVRCLTVIDHQNNTVIMYTRNGKVLENFGHVTDYLAGFVQEFGRSYVLDGEIMSGTFNQLMKQVHRKDNVNATDAVLNLFDIVPLVEFKQGRSVMAQRRRSAFLKGFENIFKDSGCITIVPQREFDLDSMVDQVLFREHMQLMVEQGYEGVMVKDPAAVYECRRSTAWLKIKPFIEASLTVTAVEEGTGKNQGKLGALVCEGTDNDKLIRVNVGSGFTDQQRQEFWLSRDALLTQVVEVRADAVSQNQDNHQVYSLRFPRFLRFRGFRTEQKI